VKSFLIKNHFYKNFQSMIFGNFSDYIVLLLEEISNQAEERVSTLKDLCNNLRIQIEENYEYTISVGIGKYNDSIKETYQSYTQAKKAIELGRTVYGDNHTTYYSELGFSIFLSLFIRNRNQEIFAENNWGQLLTMTKFTVLSYLKV